MIKKWHIGFLASAVIAGIVLLLIRMMGSIDTQDRTKVQQTVRPAAATPSQRRPVHLYFSDNEGQFLMAENRILKSPQDPEFLARSIVDALIKGPQQGLARTLPAATAIRAIFVTQNGICFVDLTSAVADNHPGGIQSELLTIFSIVNSLVLNVPQIKAVKILINGTEAKTLAGHIDLQIPIKANMLLIR
ncbi:MAG: GerMN domain-containing protein [Desulfobacterales bacterium]|jgi:spore germination protein GerM